MTLRIGPPFSTTGGIQIYIQIEACNCNSWDVQSTGTQEIQEAGRPFRHSAAVFSKKRGGHTQMAIMKTCQETNGVIPPVIASSNQRRRAGKSRPVVRLGTSMTWGWARHRNHQVADKATIPRLFQPSLKLVDHPMIFTGFQ